MISLIKESISEQFGASLQMLENAIRFCPDEHWDTDHKFWYNAFHCLFFTDYYLTVQPKEFVPPPPFSESEFEDRMPERVYTKEELCDYLVLIREKLFSLTNGLTGETIQHRWINGSGSMNYSIPEILLYNMRHVQHHAAQLNLLLRQTVNDSPGWVFRASED